MLTATFRAEWWYNLPNDLGAEIKSMGYYWDKKANTDQYKKIDVRYMQRENSLNVGNKNNLVWSNKQTGEVTSRIDYEVKSEGVCFSYRVRSNSSEAWRPYEYLVPVTYTPCNYGGYRAWFNCPYCNKRVAVLYLDVKIACRICYKLNYTSQQQTKGTWKERDRMNKVREKLNWPLFEDIYPWQRIKPKGMHHTTFNRLCQEHDHYERCFLVGFSAGLDRLESRARRIG